MYYRTVNPNVMQEWHDMGETCLDVGGPDRTNLLGDCWCWACAVENGVASPILWDYEALDAQIRQFTKRRAHVFAWWSQKKSRERYQARFACTPANLATWDEEAGLGVCSGPHGKFARDYRIKALVARVRELEAQLTN